MHVEEVVFLKREKNNHTNLIPSKIGIMKMAYNREGFVVFDIQFPS